MHRHALAFLVLTAGSALPALADTIHVAPCGDDAWTGATAVCGAPAGPKRTIQAAIDAAVNGDTVLVAAGDYTGPGNRDMDFGGRAITVRGDGGAAACVIDCQGSPDEPHRAFSFHSGETASSVLENLTLTGGVIPGDYGGAVRCEGGSPLIRSCVFHRNSAGGGGGALYLLTADPDVRIVDCTFSENTSGSGGGAAYIYPSSVTANVNVINCTFSDNTAANAAGAVLTAGAGRRAFSRCTLSGNRTTDPGLNGGGAARSAGGPETWMACNFINNSTARLGGALWFFGTQGTVTACTFDGNSAAYGGALGMSANSTAIVNNCLFTRNSISDTSRPASALWIGNGFGGPSTATVINCTFSENSAPPGGAALVVTQTSAAVAVNCILWGNTPAEAAAEVGASLSLFMCDVQGGWTGLGSDNIPFDPLFINAAARDYHLAPFSPCIDSGNAGLVLPGTITDLDGRPRFMDDPWMPNRMPGAVDMGVYEFQGRSCRADINGDGALNIGDFLSYLEAYAIAGPGADFSGDGQVNITDFLAFLSAYAAGCP